MPKKPQEDAHQIWLAEYLDLLGLWWWHTPNGGARSKAEAGRFKAMGVRRGVADIIIGDAPPRYPDARGVAIELKRPGADGPAADQEKWLRKARARGWVTAVCYGWPDARAFLESIGW